MVVVSRTPMSTGIPLLVGAGSIPELRMRDAAEALASHWQLPLVNAGVEDEPSEVLADQSLALIRLCGDPALQRKKGGHWIEALADWRRPVLILATGNNDGSVSGYAAAYNALCQQLNAVLEGLIQIQGAWNAPQRRRDGLPWCGWIPAEDDAHRVEQIERLTLCLSARTHGQLFSAEARAADPDQA